MREQSRTPPPGCPSPPIPPPGTGCTQSTPPGNMVHTEHPEPEHRVCWGGSGNRLRAVPRDLAQLPSLRLLEVGGTEAGCRWAEPGPGAGESVRLEGERLAHWQRLASVPHASCPTFRSTSAAASDSAAAAGPTDSATATGPSATATGFLCTGGPALLCAGGPAGDLRLDLYHSLAHSWFHQVSCATRCLPSCFRHCSVYLFHLGLAVHVGICWRPPSMPPSCVDCSLVRAGRPCWALRFIPSFFI